MSAANPDPATPREKVVMPPLETRAPRPAVVRLRRSVVAVAGVGAAGLLGASLGWAFVVQPELRAETREQKLGRESDLRGAVRPSQVVTDQPATYGQLDQLDQLPEPRRLGADESQASEAPTRRSPPARAVSRASGRSVAAQARESGLFFSASSRTGGDAGASSSASGASRDYAAVYNSHPLLAPLSPYELKAGAVIPALLLTGIDTARPGPVVAAVTDNIYDSVSGRHLIIPQGARLIGRHEGESRHGDKRAFLAWDRLILPNGKSVVLTREPGVDAQGAVGVRGRVDRRLGSLLVATLFAGAITALGQTAQDEDDDAGGLLGDVGDAAAIEAAQIGGKLIDRELAVRPTIRLRPGARVQVLITRDLILEPYRL